VLSQQPLQGSCYYHTKKIPTQRSLDISFRELKLTVRSPHEDHIDLERSKIGDEQTKNPKLIKGYHQELLLSARMFFRAFLIAFVAVAIFTIPFLGMPIMGINEYKAVLLAFIHSI